MKSKSCVYFILVVLQLRFSSLVLAFDWSMCLKEAGKCILDSFAYVEFLRVDLGNTSRIHVDILWNRVLEVHTDSKIALRHTFVCRSNFRWPIDLSKPHFES